MDKPIPEKQAAQAFGGVPFAPRLVNIKTRPDEVIKPAPLTKNHTAFNYLSQVESKPYDVSEWVRRGVPEGSVAPDVSVHDYLERRQWATSIWIPESEQYDPEQNTLTLRGYYRVYLFDVWVKPGELPTAEETTKP